MDLTFLNFNAGMKSISTLLVILLLSVACGKSKKAEQNNGDHKLPLLIAQDFEDENLNEWICYPEENWKVEQDSGCKVLSLIEAGPEREVRAPQAYSVLKNYDVTDFVFTGKIKSNQDTTVDGRDMDVIFHYQDHNRFYYVHFCKESSRNHNIIGLVNGKDRVKINHEPIGESIARLHDKAYHDFKVTYNSNSGEIKAYLDDMNTPILTATDSSLSHGMVGVGSFDDYGSVDDVELRGILFSDK